MTAAAPKRDPRSSAAAAAPAPTAAVVGSGPAGATMAILLAERGYRVALYDMRLDPRRDGEDEGRSINLGLSERGIRTLRRVGVLDAVLERAVPMRGRVIHGADGSLSFLPYGTQESQILHSITRRELSAVLVDRAERAGAIELHFGTRCVGLDRDTGTLRFAGGDGVPASASADLVVGADGAFSPVRGWMHRGLPADFHQEFLDWGYRELRLPAAPDGSSRIEWNALHVWPRGDGLIVSHANLDRSHTLTVFLPIDGDRSFAELTTEAAVRRFFAARFADLPRLIPDLAEQFLARPTGTLVATRAAPWYHGGRVVLVGDACHAVFPFYGQGMNSALEDCLVLDHCLEDGGGDRAAAFRRYQALRKPNTDVLADLTRENFLELRSRVRSPLFVARKRADIWLNRLFPRTWLPLYTMVSHTTIPYAEARARARRQNRLLALVALGAALAPVIAWALWPRGPRGGGSPRRRP